MINKLPLSAPSTKDEHYFGNAVYVSEQIRQDLDRISDSRKKLTYYNKNVQSLSICGMEGQIYIKWGKKPEEEIKIYCGCPGCRALPDFKTDHEHIFFELRAKEVKRLLTAIKNCKNYKDKLTILFNTPGFEPDKPRLGICENVPYDGTGNPSRDMLNAGSVIDFYPKDADEIKVYNEFVRAEYEKKYLNENGLTNSYCGFNFESERQKLQNSLKCTIDVKLLIDSKITEIKNYFNFPNSISEEESVHSALKEVQLEMGEPYTDKEYFAAKAMGEEIDFDQAIIKTWSLAYYTHISEIVQFYHHLITLQKYGYKPDSETISESTKNISTLHNNSVPLVEGVNPKSSTVNPVKGHQTKTFTEYLLHENKEVLASKIREEFKLEKGRVIRIMIEVLLSYDPQLLILHDGERSKFHKALKNYFGSEIGSYQGVFGYNFFLPNKDQSDFDKTQKKIRFILSSVTNSQHAGRILVNS